MNYKLLANLLHVADPTLPIGAYTHSNGLETFVQQKIVHDEKTAKEFVENMIKYNLKYNDGAFVRLAYEAAESNDLEELVRLDQECTALKSPREIRQANQKLGLRFIKIFGRRYTSSLIEGYNEAIKTKTAKSNYPIVFGLYTQAMQLPIEEALFGFYYTMAMGLITNAVKLVPLGQIQGQDILFSLYDCIEETAHQTLSVDRGFVGLCNTSFDVKSMQHERLYSRIYMS